MMENMFVRNEAKKKKKENMHRLKRKYNKSFSEKPLRNHEKFIRMENAKANKERKHRNDKERKKN